MKNQIYFGDNLPVLQRLPQESIELIYIDPPFNTGKKQKRTQIVTQQSSDGDRTGFSGRRNQTVKIGKQAYNDIFDDYLQLQAALHAGTRPGWLVRLLGC